MVKLEDMNIVDLLKHPACGRSENLRDRIVQEYAERCCIQLEAHIKENVLHKVCKGHNMTYKVNSFMEKEFQRLYTFYCSCGKGLGQLELNFEVR